MNTGACVRRMLATLGVVIVILGGGIARADVWAPAHGASVLDLYGKNATQKALIQRMIKNVPDGQDHVQIGCMLFKLSPDKSDAFVGTKWPGGLVYYVFSDNVSPLNRQRFLAATKVWEDVANVTFIPRTNQANFIFVQSSNVNSSFVGMIGGGQELNMFNWSFKFIIAHELGHALGLLHEQSRKDRDEFVEILFENIEDNAAFNFEKSESTVSFSPYDFESIMHYGAFDFTKNGERTIVMRPGFEEFADTIGNREYLSTGDAAGMLGRYGAVVCTYSFAQPSKQFTYAGGAGSVAVNTRSICSWAPQVNQPWVILNNGTTQTGTLNVNYTVQANTGGPRTATIKVGGSSHIITQAAFNDAFANRIEISGLSGTAEGLNEGMTLEANEPQNPAAFSDNSAWWSWTAPQSANVTFSTCGSNFDTLLEAYVGNSVDGLTLASLDATNNDANEECELNPLASTITFAAQQGVTYHLRVSGNSGEQGSIVLSWSTGFSLASSDQLNIAELSAPGSTTGWSPFGMNTAGLAAPSATGTALQGTVFAHPTKFRVAGASQNRSLWLPFASLGDQTVVRGKYYAYGTSSSGNPQEVPNLRVRIAARSAINSMLEVFHYNADTAAQNALDAELRPSSSEGNPSVYRTDLQMPMVPATSLANEGLQGAFEAFAQLPQTSGTIGLAELQVGRYSPETVPNDKAPLFTLQPSASDAGNMIAFNPAAEAQRINLIAGSTEGDPPTLDAAALAGQLPILIENSSGATINTVFVPSNRIGLGTRNFNPANGGTNFADRARVADRTQYKARFYITSTQQCNRQPQIRLRARSVKFGWSQKLEIGGANAAGSTNNLIAQQILPGTETKNPDRNDGDAGGYYNLLMVSPLTTDIRPEFASGTPVSTRMPNLSAQPGPGVNAASRRDIYLGVDILDTISAGVDAATIERGHIVVRQVNLMGYTLLKD